MGGPNTSGHDGKEVELVPDGERRAGTPADPWPARLSAYAEGLLASRTQTPMKTDTPEPAAAKSAKPRALDNVSKGRIMAVKGPKSSVAKGDASPRSRAPIVNGD